MNMIKKWIRPQILFPAAIALTFAVVMCVAVLRPKPEDFFGIKEMDEPGVAMMSWSDIDEKEFYQSMSIAVRATIMGEPTFCSIKMSPTSEENNRLPIAIYNFSVDEILANGRLKNRVMNGRVYRMSSIPSAFTDRGVEKGGSYVLMLCDSREISTFEPENDNFSEAYRTENYNKMGYDVMTPRCSLFPAEPDGSVKSTKLPEYLRGEGAFTTLEELREILHAGREKYGIPTLE